MSTTNLFVELVVIGAGAALWVVLLFLALLGVPVLSEDLAWLADKDVGIPLLLAALPVVYVLGILTDRVADWVFDLLFAGERWKRQFTNRDDYFRARRYLLHESDPFSEELAYERSRLRICRGWAVNALLLLLSWLLLWNLQGDALFWGLDSAAGWGGAAFFAAVLAASIWSWNSLNQAQVKKLRRKTDWLYERADPPIRLPARPRQGDVDAFKASLRRDVARKLGVFAMGLILAVLVYCLLRYGLFA